MQLFGISACKRGIPQINRKEVKYLDEKIRKKIDDFLHDKSQIEALQNAVVILSENYSDRVKVQGEERFSSLAAVYCIAEKNILSGTVFQFLRELDDTELIKELANNELSDLAEKQKKKIAFRDEIKHILSERKKQEKQAEKLAKAEYLQIKAEGMPSYFGKQLNQCVVESVLSESLNIRVKLNQVTKKIDVEGSGKAVLLQLYSESNLINALPLLILDECKACEVSGISGSLKLIQSYLFNIADINRYNPIHDMLNEHKNNNPENLERIYKILNLQASFDKLLVKKWLIQTVAFAFATYDNQVSTEGMLILQGKQGLAKTSFFRVIAGNPLWFNEGVCIDVSNKDSLIKAVSAWISELGEIDSTFKKDQSALKAFITSPLDRIRLPYAAAISDMPRTTSLCGTVNPDKFLKDETGNRRYWVIHVDNIDKKQLFGMSKEDVFNLWGYVYSLYLEDKQGYLLNDVEREMVEVRNLEYMTERKYEAEIRYILDFTKPVDKWEWVEPANIAQYFKNADVRQIGRAFSVIEREERAVQKRRTASGVAYYVPIVWNKIPNYYYSGIKYC